MPTRDGWICITANTNAQAFVIFDAIGRPELKDDPRFNTMEARFEHTAEYYAIRKEGMSLPDPDARFSRISTSVCLVIIAAHPKWRHRWR
jgi:crotonobetainyl-CoA:carnitine CoA-transferase CaiB-like acyl-CoA transferase